MMGALALGVCICGEMTAGHQLHEFEASLSMR